MSLPITNAVLLICVVLAIWLTSYAITRRIRASMKIAQEEARAAVNRETSERNFFRLRRLSMTLLVVNVSTNLVSLVPAGFAVYYTLVNNQQAALNIDLLGLAGVLILKGGFFLLTLILIPAMKAVPVGIGTGVGTLLVQKAAERAKKRRGPQQEE